MPHTLIDKLRDNYKPIKERIKNRIILRKLEKWNKINQYEKAELKTITVLDLSRFGLKKIPESISELQKLEKLYLNDNKIRTVPEQISKLKKLFMFSQRNNQIKELPEWIFTLKELSTIYLESNEITKLPENIGNNKHLMQLFLSDNKLTNLPESIIKLENLVRITLSNNKLRKIPAKLCEIILHGEEISCNLDRNNFIQVFNFKILNEEFVYDTKEHEYYKRIKKFEEIRDNLLPKKPDVLTNKEYIAIEAIKNGSETKEIEEIMKIDTSKVMQKITINAIDTQTRIITETERNIRYNPNEEDKKTIEYFIKTPQCSRFLEQIQDKIKDEKGRQACNTLHAKITQLHKGKLV